MSLKFENSRREDESRPVCMDLKRRAGLAVDGKYSVSRRKKLQ